MEWIIGITAVAVVVAIVVAAVEGNRIMRGDPPR
jgi:hypothetical protein